MSGYLKENKDKTGKTISFRIGAPRGKDPDQPGKYKYAFRTVKTDSVRVAQKALRDLQHEIDKGTYVEPGKTTLSDYLDSWLSDNVQPNLSPRTHELYSYMCDKHIKPAIGNLAISDLQPRQIQHLYADKQKSGLSNRTVQLVHVTLHKALKNAAKTGLISRNPAESVDIPKIKRHEMHTLSEDDLQRFLEAAKTTEYYPLFYTILFTGLRRSEALALRWQDIDLLLCQLSVTRSLQQLHNVKVEKRLTFKETKTVKSRRLIALTPSNVGVLREHRAKQEAQRIALDQSPLSESDLVFAHYDGSPYLPDSITHIWMKLVRRNGLTGVRLHDARHTHASLMLKQGIHPKVVQERLGHAGIAITLDLYSHTTPGLQQAAANKFDEIAQPKPSKLDRELQEITK